MTKESFRSGLLSWYDQHKRELPWRKCEDPYKIWISEIMLQQTRVDQVIPYYNRFIARFPSVEDLASADRQEVLKVWEGLGYYSRARNLHQAAKTVVEKYDGQIPATEDEITKLKGIGPYTAAALLSIIYNQPCAVVDGNVLRVLTRYYGMASDIRKQSTKNEIQELADELIDSGRPGDFNQALMELGATICTPTGPDCPECPLQSGCKAYKTAKTDSIPYKSPAREKPHHHIGVGIIYNENNQVLIALRPDNAMLGGLWEFPGGKKKEEESITDTVKRELREELGVNVEIERPFMKLDHAYSHFSITLHAYLCSIISGSPTANTSRKLKWVEVDKLTDFPFPKANRELTRKLVNQQKGQQQLDF